MINQLGVMSMKQSWQVKVLAIGLVGLLIMNFTTIYMLLGVRDQNDDLTKELEDLTNTDGVSIAIERDIYGGGSNPDPDGGTAKIVVNITNRIDRAIAPYTLTFVCRSFDENEVLYHEIAFQIDDRIAPGEHARGTGYLHVSGEYSGTIGMEIFAFYLGKEILHRTFTGNHY